MDKVKIWILETETRMGIECKSFNSADNKAAYMSEQLPSALKMIRNYREALELVVGIMEGCYIKDGKIKLSDIAIAQRALDYWPED